MEQYIKGRRFSGLWHLSVDLFGIAAWLVLICIENFYLIIDWLIVALYIHYELLKNTYLFNINGGGEYRLFFFPLQALVTTDKLLLNIMYTNKLEPNLTFDKCNASLLNESIHFHFQQNICLFNTHNFG